MRKTKSFASCVCAKGALAALCAALVLAGSLTGCWRGNESFVTSNDFSINIGDPAPQWPKKMSKLSKAEQDVLKLKGRPEKVRIWWMPSGEPINKSTMFRLQRQPKAQRPNALKRSWIYLSRNEEVIFVNSAQWRVQPLADKLRTMCEVGDPQEIRYRPSSRGDRSEEWIYYNLGLIYRFVGDRLVETDRSSIPPMPNFLTR